MLKYLLPLTIIVIHINSYAAKTCLAADNACYTQVKDIKGNFLFQKLQETQGLKVCEKADDKCFGILNGELTKKAMHSYYIPYKPTEMPWDVESKTIILVHGLSDSPFYMKEIAESMHNKGFNILSVLLAGHGNSTENGPMDLVDIKFKDWQENLIDSVLFSLWVSDSIHFIGFSTGSALITNFLVKHKIKKHKNSVLISPAIELKQAKMLILGSLIYGKDHIVSEPKKFGHGARYLFYPLNAPNQLRLLNKETKKLMKKYKIDSPVLSIFAASEDTFDVASVNTRLKDNVENYISVVLGNPRAAIANPENSLYEDKKFKKNQIKGIENSLVNKDIDFQLLENQYVEHSSPLSGKTAFRGEFESVQEHELVLDIIHEFLINK
ncbi:MAG: alpha/beta fold hydrolase [Bdellovibrionota bacterium]|nr:alpha/beta fold hydrolase [Bdellovibrionota bacterium]